MIEQKLKKCLQRQNQKPLKPPSVHPFSISLFCIELWLARTVSTRWCQNYLVPKLTSNSIRKREELLTEKTWTEGRWKVQPSNLANLDHSQLTTTRNLQLSRLVQISLFLAEQPPSLTTSATKHCTKTTWNSTCPCKKQCGMVSQKVIEIVENHCKNKCTWK